MARTVRVRNGRSVCEMEETTVNMNLPELAPFAWRVQDQTVHRFGADDDVPLRDTFAYEAVRELRLERSRPTAVARVLSHVRSAFVPSATGASRLRRQWWPRHADRVAVSGNWNAL